MNLIKLTMLFWVICCSQLQRHPNQDKVDATKLFTRADAERIMGSATHATDSVIKQEANSSSYLCGFKTNKADPQSGKIGATYFLFEDYKNIDGAAARYKDVYVSNKNNGIKPVEHLGDEAFYHTDNENFDLMMVRKAHYVFNIKVNKRTSTTSLNELKKTVKRITDKI